MCNVSSVWPSRFRARTLSAKASATTGGAADSTCIRSIINSDGTRFIHLHDESLKYNYSMLMHECFA
jgi:hypothetical protein